jgi:CBS domain-containing protein
MTVQGLAQLLAERGISGAPVVDTSGSLVGIVSEGDLLHRAEIGTAYRHHRRRRSWWLDHFASEAAREYIKSHGRTVGDIMSREVVTVGEETDLGDVAELLEAKRIRRVPVMRDNRSSGSSAGPTLYEHSGRRRGPCRARVKRMIVRSAPVS